jgi:hypothetical protein
MNLKLRDVDVTMSDEDGKVVNVVNEDNAEQVLPSQVVEVDIVNKDHGDVDVISDNENMNVVNMDRVSEDKPEQFPTS